MSLALLTLCLPLLPLSHFKPTLVTFFVAWEVSSAARAARDKKPPVTIGSRGPEDRGFDRQQAMPHLKQADNKANRRLHRFNIMLRGKPQTQQL
jgi:hypothetical protein